MNIKIIKNGCINNCCKGIFNYFGWPTVGRLSDGTIMVVCSGLRTWHVDPFGKVVAFYSRDEGKTFSPPTIICDTPLDDRDAGFCRLNDGRVMITSFNNNVAFQSMAVDLNFKSTPRYDLIKAYLQHISPEQEEDYCSSYYKLSSDGYIFDDDIIKVPISSPHGPIQLKNGTIFYVGGIFEKYSPSNTEKAQIGFITSKDGLHWSSVIKMDMGDVADYSPCEPHAIELANGRILVIYRVSGSKDKDENIRLFYNYSDDEGKTFSSVREIKNLSHGGPPHLLMHSSGVLVCAYGYRKEPFGQRVMLSCDNGEHWQTDFILRDDGLSWDLGYPSSIELDDGKILTVYYQANEKNNHLLQYTIWELEK